MTRKILDIIILTGLTLVAVLLYVSTAQYPQSVQHSTASYVRFLSASLAMLAVIQIGISVKKIAEQEKVFFYTNRRRFFTLLALLVLYVVVIFFLGFMLATMFFLPSTMYAMGYRNKKIIVISSIGLLLFLELIFVMFLRVPLPRGYFF